MCGDAQAFIRVHKRELSEFFLVLSLEVFKDHEVDDGRSADWALIAGVAVAVTLRTDTHVAAGQEDHLAATGQTNHTLIRAGARERTSL